MALVGWVRRGPALGGGEIFDDSAITPATVRRFSNSFLFGPLWDVLLWSQSFLGSVSYRQVAPDGGVEGLSLGKRRV